jgi:RNA-binding protein YhbY
MPETLTFHIGKNGLTKEFIDHLNIAFKSKKIVKVQLLKSASSDREKMEKTTSEIISGLTGKFNYRIIGFTIILMKRASK